MPFLKSYLYYYQGVKYNFYRMPPEQPLNPENISPEEQKAALLPAEHADYLQAVERKHFNAETAIGSVFTEISRLPDLLSLAIKQRGSLTGDDRVFFEQQGVSPDSLRPDCRYLKIETAGRVGIVSIDDPRLLPEQSVEVIQAKPKVPATLVVELESMPETDIGTIIIGPNVRESPADPEPTTKEMVYSVHPGLPIKPTEENIWPVGSRLTVKEVKDKLGRQAYLNVRKKENP